MSAEAFLDTNVIVYSFDRSAATKRTRAEGLLADSNWVCSWQVIQEFAHVALHRFAVAMHPSDLREYLALVLWPRCAVFPSRELHFAALRIHQQTQYRFYDSLILASALAAGVPVLYSEDLQANRSIQGVKIINPFD